MELAGALAQHVYAYTRPLENFFDSIFTLHYDVGEPNAVSLLANATYVLPFSAISIYLLVIYLLPVIMKNHEGFANNRFLKVFSMFWNLLLCILSFIIFITVSVAWFNRNMELGPWGTFCNSDGKLYGMKNAMVFWAYIFGLSKYLELGDTVILILKKPQRPIMFLHWYHHVTVLLFTWFAELWRFAPGFIFIIVNACVHTFMYYYYFETDRGNHPSWNKYLTQFQIGQMFVGIAVNFVWIFVFVLGKFDLFRICTCDRPWLVIISGGIMYGTYLYLFLMFYLDKYDPRPVKASSAKKTSKKPSKSD